MASPKALTELEKRDAAVRFARSIALDIVLTIFLCGLWNIWVQARQMDALNFLLREPRYNFWKWLLLCLITCSLYHIYHEYKMSKDLCLLMGRSESDRPLIHLVLTCVGLSIVVDALQQSEINDLLGEHGV